MTIRKGLWAHAHNDPALAITALALGEALARPLSEPERLTVAIASVARPTHLLTLDSPPDLDRAGAGQEWRKLIRRIVRSRSTRRPVIYFGSFAQSGAGGYHAHMLLWEFLHLGMIRSHLRDLRFGQVRIERLPSPVNLIGPPTIEDHVKNIRSLAEVGRATAYVLGQHQSIFGNAHHRRHAPRQRYKRRFVYPSKSTLAAHKPELLAALETAKDRSVPDSQLAQNLPRFSSRHDAENLTLRDNEPARVSTNRIRSARDVRQGQGAINPTQTDDSALAK